MCFVYPEQKDIVIVGPAEGWKVDGRGNVVGVTSGKPVMHLDDLLVALRTASGPAQSGITCSIDPTPEGLQQLKSQASKLRTMQNPESTAAAFEQALGRQQITFSGRAGYQPIRRRAGWRRLSDEAIGDELRSVARSRTAEFLADDGRHGPRHEQHDAAMVA